MIEASSRCRCDELDTTSCSRSRAPSSALAPPVSAHCRPHSYAITAVKRGMARRSIGKLVKQMEAFDARVAGGWQNDALKFEEVLGNERLLNYFCNALPRRRSPPCNARGDALLPPPGATRARRGASNPRPGP